MHRFSDTTHSSEEHLQQGQTRTRGPMLWVSPGLGVGGGRWRHHMEAMQGGRGGQTAHRWKGVGEGRCSGCHVLSSCTVLPNPDLDQSSEPA